MAGSTALETLLRRDRAIVLACLAGLTGLAWLHLARMAVGAGTMAAPPGTAHLAITFAMWATMMAGMMLPSAAPMILLFAALERKRGVGHGPGARTAAFTLGYLLIWTAFSLAAVAAQQALSEAALLSPTLASSSRPLGGVLLIAAGAYQLTPLKHACLRRCRSPIQLITRIWQPGISGALRMGVAHGAYCVGCCWLLMGLLFVGGVMNLLWVAAIAAFVLVEKLVPRGELVARASGVLMLVAGAYLILQPPLGTISAQG